MLAPRTTDWHLWEVGAPTKWNRTRRRCTGSMSRSTWRSTLGLSRMGIQSGGLQLWTLFLCNMILTHQGPLSSRVRHQGNVMAMLKLGSKKPYTAAILMELVFLLHTHGCSLAANHVPREFNQWADELTHPDFSGFDPLQRVPKQELCEEFVFLPRLLKISAWAHPCSRDRSRWVTHFPWWQTPLWPGCHGPRLRGGRYQSAHPFFSF